MKLELIFFTRTQLSDYRFHRYPHAIAEDTAAFLQQQLSSLQSRVLNPAVQLFVGTSDAVLVRIANTGKTDRYGRSIRALEGFYCPEEDIHAFWLYLDRIAPALYAAPSFFDKLLDGENPTDYSAKQLFDALLTMPKDISLSDRLQTAIQPVSFVYQPDKCTLSMEQAASYSVWKPTEAQRCTLELSLDRKQHKAVLTAYTVGQPRLKLLETQPISFDRDGFPITKLERAAAEMKKQLTDWEIEQGGVKA